MKPTVEDYLQIEIAQRFKTLIDMVGETVNTIAKQTGIAGTSGLYQIIMSANPKYEGRRHLPSTYNLIKLKKKYPWMNLNYLLAGEGKPRLDKDSGNEDLKELQAKFDQLQERLQQAEKLAKAYEMVIDNGKKSDPNTEKQ